MDDRTFSRPRLRLVSSAQLDWDDHMHRTSADPTGATVRVVGPEPEPGKRLRRRYTVTVQPDGTELLDDMEEWEE